MGALFAVWGVFELVGCFSGGLGFLGSDCTLDACMITISLALCIYRVYEEKARFFLLIVYRVLLCRRCWTDQPRRIGFGRTKTPKDPLVLPLVRRTWLSHGHGPGTPVSIFRSISTTTTSSLTSHQQRNHQDENPSQPNSRILHSQNDRYIKPSRLRSLSRYRPLSSQAKPRTMKSKVWVRTLHTYGAQRLHVVVEFEEDINMIGAKSYLLHSFRLICLYCLLSRSIALGLAVQV